MGKKILDECHPYHLWSQSIFHGATGVAFEVYRTCPGILRDSFNAMRMTSARSVGLDTDMRGSVCLTGHRQRRAGLLRQDGVARDTISTKGEPLKGEQYTEVADEDGKI